MFLRKLFHVAIKIVTWVVPPVALALVSIFTGGLALPMALGIGFAASYAFDRMHTFSLKAANILEKQDRSFLKHALNNSTPNSTTTPENEKSKGISIKKSQSFDTISSSPAKYNSRKDRSARFFDHSPLKSSYADSAVPPIRIEFSESPKMETVFSQDSQSPKSDSEIQEFKP